MSDDEQVERGLGKAVAEEEVRLAKWSALFPRHAEVNVGRISAISGCRNGKVCFEQRASSRILTFIPSIKYPVGDISGWT